MGIVAGLVALALVVGCGGSANDPPSTAVPDPAAGTPPRPSALTPPPLDAEAEARLAQLRANAESKPDDDSARAQLAVALFEARRTEEALGLFIELARRDPGSAGMLNLARAYTQLSRFPEAEQTYRDLLAREPNQPVALHNLGNIAAQRGDAESAIELYRQAIAARPTYVLAWFHLGQSLKDAGQFREAYETYGRVLNLDPTTPQELEAFDDALYEMAALDLSMGAYDRAARMLEELLRANPEHRSAHYAYGNALLQLGRVEEAEAEFAKHMEILARQEPDSPMATGR